MPGSSALLEALRTVPGRSSSLGCGAGGHLQQDELTAHAPVPPPLQIHRGKTLQELGFGSATRRRCFTLPCDQLSSPPYLMVWDRARIPSTKKYMDSRRLMYS